MDILVPFTRDVLRLCLWLVLLMAIFVPLEKRWALHPGRRFRKVDIFYYFLSSLAPKLLLVLPLSLLTALVHKIPASSYYEAVASLPTALRLSLAFVVGEIGAYWGHRWSHEIPLLWRFHSLHHGVEEMDWLVHTRAHPFDLGFTRLCALIPLYLLGLAQPTANSLDLLPILITILGTIWGFFIHANLNWRLGWLESLIASPAFHHWHHTNDGPDQINKNYSAMLPWLDRCFGTLYLPTHQWPASYGVLLTPATPSPVHLDDPSGSLSHPS